MTRKKRVDVLLLERGLVESRTQAQRYIMAGRVRVEGQVVHKPSKQVPENAELNIEAGPRYVSRGGDKLAAAIATFEFPVNGRVCADVGASTGGFTDCLLQHQAERVYAIDVGQGILHWRLRNHPRVIVMERTNARWLEALPEKVGLVTVDVSFISLRLVLPPVPGWLVKRADVVMLIKPQFEAGKAEVGKGGVVRDPEVHQRVVKDIMAFTTKIDLMPQAIMRSPLLGAKGNAEFLLWCQLNGVTVPAEALLRDLF
jgi:23S rRNA (cytidine1920-2'-O)/16S rRNA (cytidine1409-2'-O)-methyltransferase